MGLIEILGEFSLPKHRIASAHKLAALLRAQELVIFIYDHELDTLLPAPGFSQNLNKGLQWQAFINSSDQPCFTGSVPYENGVCPGVAVRGHAGAIAVLIGGNPMDEDVALLRKLMFIVVPLLIQEQLTQVAESKALQNEKMAKKAELLTSTLESIRKNLTNAMQENTRLLHLTRRQNQKLTVANKELAASNEEVIAGLEDLNAANHKLMSINADLDNFIYTASHDLKSPVSNIEGLVNMLTNRLRCKGWQDAQTSKILGMIDASINRFKETIADLTKVIKAEKSTDEPSEHINLSWIIQTVIGDLHLSLNERNAQITTRVDTQTSIRFSKKNLQSIVYNLLSNAIKYSASDRRPEILIQFRHEGAFYVLSVSDNGIGMDSSDEEKIFGLFKRLHNHVEGTGIGLYIIKKIVEAAGGRIEVQSTIGKGSTFSVFFKQSLICTYTDSL